MRIVSLLPSATEILCALGLRDQIVGISHECDYPDGIASLPVVTASRITPNAKSRQIDDEVRHALQNGLSLYQIDEAKLAELRPDLIVTQDQCQVCAVSLQQLEQILRKHVGNQTRVCSVHPRILSDIPKAFLQIAEATGKSAEGERLAARFRERLDRLSGFQFPAKPRVLCLEWLDPPMVGGLWIPELVKKAGGIPLIVDKPKKFEQADWPTLIKAKPDILCLFPCGYSIARTLEELEARENQTKILNFRAATEGRCYLIDGNHYFNRPGPRIAESVEILAHLMHPSLAKQIPVPKDSFVIWRPPY